MAQITRINADDFGINLRTSAYICNAYLQCKVDCVSMMVVTTALKDAVDMVKHYHIDTGLHLSLTYPKRSYRQFIVDYFKNDIPDALIKYEFQRQIEIFLSTGIPLQRIDSHHGVHLYPRCWNILMDMMKQYRIPLVRNPARRFCFFNKNPKLWIGKNKAWFFYKINKQTYGNPLPYKEIIWHA